MSKARQKIKTVKAVRVKTHPVPQRPKAHKNIPKIDARRHKPVKKLSRRY